MSGSASRAAEPDQCNSSHKHKLTTWPSQHEVKEHKQAATGQSPHSPVRKLGGPERSSNRKQPFIFTVLLQNSTKKSNTHAASYVIYIRTSCVLPALKIHRWRFRMEQIRRQHPPKKQRKRQIISKQTSNMNRLFLDNHETKPWQSPSPSRLLSFLSLSSFVLCSSTVSGLSTRHLEELYICHFKKGNTFSSSATEETECKWCPQTAAPTQSEQHHERWFISSVCCLMCSTVLRRRVKFVED